MVQFSVHIRPNAEVFIVGVVVWGIMVSIAIVEYLFRGRAEDISSRNRNEVVTAVWASRQPYRSLNNRLDGLNVTVLDIRENAIVVRASYFHTPKPIDVDFALEILMPTGAVRMVGASEEDWFVAFFVFEVSHVGRECDHFVTSVRGSHDLS